MGAVSVAFPRNEGACNAQDQTWMRASRKKIARCEPLRGTALPDHGDPSRIFTPAFNCTLVHARAQVIVWVELTNDQRAYYRALLSKQIGTLLGGGASKNLPGETTHVFLIKSYTTHQQLIKKKNMSELLGVDGVLPRWPCSPARLPNRACLRLKRTSSPLANTKSLLGRRHAQPGHGAPQAVLPPGAWVLGFSIFGLKGFRV